jgi:hypothetical protein
MTRLVPATRRRLTFPFLNRGRFEVVFRTRKAAALVAATLLGLGAVFGAGLSLGRLGSLVTAVGAVGAGIAFAWKWLGASKDTFGALQDVATVIGIGVAGRMYFKRRQHMPRLDVSLSVTHHNLDDDRVLIAVRANLKNHGALPVTIPRAKAFVELIAPVTAEVEKHLAERVPDALVMNNVIAWNGIEECQCEPNMYLEPGETDVYPWDFVIPTGVRTIQVYAHFDNERRSGEAALGWSARAMHDIPETSRGKGNGTTQHEGNMMTDGKKDFRKGITDATNRAPNTDGGSTRQQTPAPTPESITVPIKDNAQIAEQKSPQLVKMNELRSIDELRAWRPQDDHETKQQVPQQSPRLVDRPTTDKPQSTPTVSEPKGKKQ